MTKVELLKKAIEIRKAGKKPMIMAYMFLKLGEDRYELKRKIYTKSEAEKLIDNTESIYGINHIVIVPAEKYAHAK